MAKKTKLYGNCIGLSTTAPSARKHSLVSEENKLPIRQIGGGTAAAHLDSLLFLLACLAGGRL